MEEVRSHGSSHALLGLCRVTDADRRVGETEAASLWAFKQWDYSIRGNVYQSRSYKLLRGRSNKLMFRRCRPVQL